jgi:hypothetical protein
MVLPDDLLQEGGAIVGWWLMGGALHLLENCTIAVVDALGYLKYNRVVGI